MVIKKLRLALVNAPFESSVGLVAAVSGGRDSMALLHGLLSLRETYALRLVVATFDHGLRAASGQDAAFVQAWCEQQAVRVIQGRAEVRALAAVRKESVEMAARRARYGFLAEVARTHDCLYVVTAHHADDQAETLLMHLLRGAGLAGLRGMQTLAVHPFDPDIRVWRPLLGVTRADIDEYVHQHHIPYREDETNADPRHARNRVRHELLPLLETYNPQVVAALGRLADHVQADTDALDAQLQQAVEPYLVRDATTWMLTYERFVALSVALQRRLLRLAHSTFSQSQVNHDPIEAARHLMLQGDIRKQAVLPDGITVRLLYRQKVKMLVIGRQQRTVGLLTEAFQPQIMRLGETLALTEASLHLSSQVTQGTVLHVPVSSLFEVRARRRGDTLQPAGLAGRHTSLADWMVDHQVPREHRDRVPLLWVNGVVAAIVLPDQIVITEVFRQPFEDSQPVAISLTL